MPGLSQRTFAGGEISPAIASRADTTKWQTGVKTLRNFFVMRHGGAANRSGTKFIVATKNNAAARLIPFIFNNTQTYVIELGNGYIRIVQSSVQLTISAPSAYSAGTNYTAGDFAATAGPTTPYYYCILPNGPATAVKALSDTSYWYPITGVIFEMPSPFVAADLFDVTYTQSGDVLSLFHPDRPPQALSRLAATTWTIAAQMFAPNISTPTGIATVKDGNSTLDLRYKVTAVKADTYEESLPGYAGAGVGIGVFGDADVSGITAYSAAINYTVGEQVTSGGLTYVCIQINGPASSVQSPSVTAYWYATAGANLIAWTGGVAHGLTTGDNPLFALTVGEAALISAINGSGHTITTIGTPGTTTFTIDNTAGSLFTVGASGQIGIPFVLIEDAANATTSNHEITWTAVTGAVEYWIYKNITQQNELSTNVYGYVGNSMSTTWIDEGTLPNLEETPPQYRNPFNVPTQYPAAGGYFQQRAVYANTDDEPRKVWMTHAGSFKNLTIRSPIQDDDAVTFEIAGQRINQIKHVLDLGQLVILTEGAEWAARGDSDGVVRPNAINLRASSYNGASGVTPVIIDQSALYVQARGAILRDMRYDIQTDGYSGNDLTAFASHLVDGHTIVDMAYAQREHSQVFCVRDDGVLLGLTYVREQEIAGWYHYDTGASGLYRSVCVVPEGEVDAVYVVVQRTVNGATVRHIERFADRKAGYDDYSATIDPFFVDDGVTYNGLNLTLDGVNYAAATVTMTLSGASYVAGQPLTLTASASSFQGGSGDYGQQVRLTLGAATVDVTVSAVAHTATVLTCTAAITVPVALQAVPTTTWHRLIQTLAVVHLEGVTAAILGDGIVHPQDTIDVGSPFLATFNSYVGVAQVGIPIQADLETLDVDSAQSQDLGVRQKIVSGVALQVQHGMGSIKLGPDSAGLLPTRLSPTSTEPALITDKVPLHMQTKADIDGRVFIRLDDPTPLMILSINPEFAVGGRQ